jgi:hypothetical protein
VETVIDRLETSSIIFDLITIMEHNTSNNLKGMHDASYSTLFGGLFYAMTIDGMDAFE